MSRALRLAAAILALAAAPVLAQERDRITVKHFPAPTPMAAWEPLEVRIERVRMPSPAADRLFGEVEHTLAVHGIASDWQFVIPDGPFIRITIEAAGRRIELASAHTLFERDGKAIALERGVQALEGRDAKALLAGQSESFRNRRLAFEKILALVNARLRESLGP